MNANEVPEKIYIDDFGSELSYDWHTEHCYENDIEYIRKDAFIKKACLWLKDNTDRYLYNTGGIDEYIPKCGDKMIEDFKKYMEDLL